MRACRVEARDLTGSLARISRVTRRELLERGFVFASIAALGPRGCTWPNVERTVRATRSASRRALALATADGQAHVVAVSVGAGRIQARIPTLEGPRSVERAPGAQAL